MIHAYLAELDRTLRGPAGAKADLLREARDGLLDAAEAYAESGLARDEAQRRAVADFGDVREIAPDYQAELGAAQGRRTALLICLVLAVQAPLWRYVGGALAGEPRRTPAEGYAVVDGLTSWLGGSALAGTLLAALACGIGVRYLPHRLVVAATGYFAYAVAATFAVIGVLMLLWGPNAALSPAGLPMFLLCLALPMAWIARAGRRCHQAAQAAPVTPESVRPDGAAARSR